MLRTVQVIGMQRVVRVVIDVNNYDERDVIVSIGHELAHVTEVLDDQTIRTDAQVVMMYARSNSGAIGGVFETVAATAAGAAIRAEIQSWRIDGAEQKRRAQGR
jgi:actin-related protein